MFFPLPQIIPYYILLYHIPNFIFSSFTQRKEHQKNCRQQKMELKTDKGK